MLEKVRAERPQDYLKVVASILPRELNVKLGEYEEMSDDELDRRIIQLKIEQEALKKETDAASKDRLNKLEGELADLEEKSAALTARWRAEKDKLGSAQKLKEQLETARNDKLIGAPLEARVRLAANGDLYPLLERHARELPGLFIVSQVEVERGGAGVAGIANSGGGGGGGGANGSGLPASTGGGGGEGEYAELLINTPAASYTYTVGGGGTAGTSGTGGGAGGAGGSGYIIVDEYYW